MVHRVASTLIVCAALLVPSAAVAQTSETYSAPKPRRHFVSVSLDWLYTLPLHFAEHPVEDLVGSQVAIAQFEAYEYRTRDDRILVDVLEFNRRSRGASVTVYPLGLSAGSALALRGSIEGLPVVRIDFAGAGAPPAYALMDGKAYDVGIGLFSADRSMGWGLGSHAFVLGGVGRIRSDLGRGNRVFAEGGGGLSSGPFGLELSVKFALNRLNEPVEHSFITVPVTLRGTLTF